MRRLVPLALCIVAIGCGSNIAPTTLGPSFSATPSGTAALTSTAPISSQRAEVLEGPFQLLLEMPRDTWGTDEAFDGLATLALVRGSGLDLGGSGGGVIQFEFAEVNGSRDVLPVSTSDCGPYRIEPATPITSSIRSTHRSVGFTADDPNADFYRSFVADPIPHLPAGDWRITAIATFIEGQRCSGQSHTMRASVLVHVTG